MTGAVFFVEHKQQADQRYRVRDYLTRAIEQTELLLFGSGSKLVLSLFPLQKSFLSLWCRAARCSAVLCVKEQLEPCKGNMAIEDGSFLREHVTLLVAWAVRLSLEKLRNDHAAGHPRESSSISESMLAQLLEPGDPLDLLRPQASARPRDTPRTGLIVQPFFWALALAVADLSCHRDRERARLDTADSSIAALQTGGGTMPADVVKHTEVFVREILTMFSTDPETSPGRWVATLHGACEMCPQALHCPTFVPTAYRPEVCVCAHGAAHHVPSRPDPPACCGTTKTGAPEIPIEQPSSVDAAAKTDACSDEVTYSPVFGSTTSRKMISRIPSGYSVEVLLHAKHFLSSLGAAGIRDLLELRRTVGSLNGPLPPSRRTLLTSLNLAHAPHLANKGSSTSGVVAHAAKGADEGEQRVKKPSSGVVVMLTVGGRALCKHFPRGREGWWGNSGGTESDKSERAEKAALRIISSATWVNLHTFGGGGTDGVFEVRESMGYGARWSVDGRAFRGFLEPHMEDGHAKGWKH